MIPHYLMRMPRPARQGLDRRDKSEPSHFPISGEAHPMFAKEHSIT